ncbi:hypothetical protein NPIL_299281 [Nephila pilipes]|uniref:Uncharacterized protein n=1 Tax=Nephila pilipes TaxID=299642 RepID=A0A8X6MNN7_NEPPI|nr:hypothetical protein NPIL_299281 [Nephila pilipes]
MVFLLCYQEAFNPISPCNSYRTAAILKGVKEFGEEIFTFSIGSICEWGCTTGKDALRVQCLGGKKL